MSGVFYRCVMGACLLASAWSALRLPDDDDACRAVLVNETTLLVGLRACADAGEGANLMARFFDDYGSPVEAIAALETVEVIDFSDGWIGDYGAISLASSIRAGDFARVHTVRLGGCGLTDDGVVPLLRSLRAALPRVRELSLRHSTMSIRGARALSSLVASDSSRLEVLDLRDAALEDDAVVIILAGLGRGGNRSLLHLDLGENRVADYGAIVTFRILRASVLPEIRHVAIGIGVEAVGILALTQALTRTTDVVRSLDHIDLSYNRLDGVAAMSLAVAIRGGGLDSVRRLSLRGTSLGDVGCVSVAQALCDAGRRGVAELDLRENGFGRIGVASLDSLRRCVPNLRLLV